MKQRIMIENIYTRLEYEYEQKGQKCPITRAQIKQVIKAYDKELLVCIANCDSFRTGYGTVEGKKVMPKKIVGLKNGVLISGQFWSAYKIGWPTIRWNNAARDCKKLPAKSYFELPEVRYTSFARKWRQDLSLPEIPEYEGLPEEKIKELCEKADAVVQKPLTECQKRHKKFFETYTDARRQWLWEYKAKVGAPINYLPPGVTLPEGLTLEDYYQQTVNRIYLDHKDEFTLPEAYNMLLNLKQLFIKHGQLDGHEFINELFISVRDEMKAQNIPEPIFEDWWQPILLQQFTVNRIRDAMKHATSERQTRDNIQFDGSIIICLEDLLDTTLTQKDYEDHYEQALIDWFPEDKQWLL